MMSRTNITVSETKNNEERNEKILETSLGIDIGSIYIRAVVTKNSKIIKKYKIVSEGVDRGMIVEAGELEEKIKTLVNRVSKDFKPFPEKVVVGIGTDSQESVSTSISVFTKRSDGYITEDDIDYAKEEASKRLNISKNKTILHSAITSVSVDDEQVTGNPIGMNGYKIDLRILFIIDSIKMQNDIANIFNNLKVDISDIVSGPFAESVLSLTKKDKRIGAASINIGGQNTSIVVYENNTPVLCKVIKSGGEDITSDMALGLRVTFDEAEKIKVGDALSDQSRRRSEELIETRVEYIAKRINEELAIIKKDGLLPSGIFIMGGTSNLKKIDTALRHYLRLPVTHVMNNLDAQTFDLDSTEYLKAFAVTLFAGTEAPTSKAMQKIKNIAGSIKNRFKKYLP